jgi:hypothetical protein
MSGRWTTSVETALNSRCSSDYDDDPFRGHWGMFDPERGVTEEEREEVLEAAGSIPRFTSRDLVIREDENRLLFLVEGGVEELEGCWVNVESGMQQEAVHLACAAMGLGTCIYNLGVNGRPWGSMIATVKMGLGGMKPSFGGKMWEDKPPEDWLPGNLPEPRRSSNVALMDVIKRLELSASKNPATEADISQILWAMRGRTPHLYGGKRWGLTIPTWAGGQNYTSLYILLENGTFSYVNWEKDRPTHGIRRIGDVTPERVGEEARAIVVLGVNEGTGRALWEIGYMLENALVQAAALEISYKAVLLDAERKRRFSEAGFKDPVAAFIIL